jgi:hypothetical protein
MGRRSGSTDVLQQIQFANAHQVIAVLRYVDPCPGLPCRARRPRPAECRPKFISVTAWGAQFPGAFNLVQQVQSL